MTLEKNVDFRKLTFSFPHNLLLYSPKDLFNEGFRKKSEEMNAEISHLRNLTEIIGKDETPWIPQNLDTLATDATAVLPVPVTCWSESEEPELTV